MKWILAAPVAAVPLGSGIFGQLFGLTTSSVNQIDAVELGSDSAAELDTAPILQYKPVGALDNAAPFAQQQPISSQKNIRDLDWGALNFIHTTDTHSWLSGHLLQPDFGANWGDFVSFSTHMHQLAAEKNSDLLLVDTGDRTDGNGLGDATKDKAVHIRSLFSHVPYDVITIGNHELYDGRVTVHEYNELFSHFKESYVVSNVYVKAKKVKRQQYANLEFTNDYNHDSSHKKWIPMGNKYRLWQTPNTNQTILGLGFLFDFSLNDDHYSKVVPAKNEIKSHWFQSLLSHKIGTGEVDAIVLAGHIPIRDAPDFEAIVKEIRKHNAHVPILLFGGHTHIRDAKLYDKRAWGLESGRYLETIGFASLEYPHGGHHHHHHHHNGTLPPHHNGTHPHLPPHHNGTAPNTTVEATSAHEFKYTRSYIDFNRRSLAHHAQQDTFDTFDGRKISSKIAHYRKKLDLDHKLACVPKTYYTNQVPYPHEESLFSLLGDEVLPRIVSGHRNRQPSYVLLNTGAIRYDLVKGPYTRDSGYIVTPFSKKWLVIEDMPREVADEILTMLNGYDQVSADIGYKHSIGEGERATNSTLTPGYTTHDDFGSSGDDTEHDGWTFHRIPNVIHAERNVESDTDEVDFVFEEFLTHFIVKALVELRKYRLIRPRFYIYSPLHEALAEYLGNADTC